MKIGLYLQDVNEDKQNPEVFYDAMNEVKKSDIDLLVFPECCYTPFVDELYTLDIFKQEGYSKVEEYCSELSEYVGCPIIFSSVDNYGTIYSIYINAFAADNETFLRLYVKHTATDYSAFDIEPYNEIIELNFEPIIYRSLKIGMTICYDCNHAIFSRAYHKEGVDILINSTGGNIVYDKWHKYNKVRSIENHCFNFCTMGYAGDYKKINSYVFGYTPNGKEMKFTNLTYKGKDRNKVGTVYVFDTDSDDGSFDVDSSINQIHTTNKIQNYFYPCDGTDELMSKSIRIDEKLYTHKHGKENIIYCIVEGREILQPEKILHYLYHDKLKKIENKRYIIINRWQNLNSSLYENQISDVLKVRSMENFCAVILESDSFNNCYQCGMNRTAQIVKAVNGKYGLDLNRTSGPEAIWKNKNGMRAVWRNGFEALLRYIEK